VPENTYMPIVTLDYIDRGYLVAVGIASILGCGEAVEGNSGHIIDSERIFLARDSHKTAG